MELYQFVSAKLRGKSTVETKQTRKCKLEELGSVCSMAPLFMSIILNLFRKNWRTGANLIFQDTNFPEIFGLAPTLGSKRGAEFRVFLDSTK